MNEFSDNFQVQRHPKVTVAEKLVVALLMCIVLILLGTITFVYDIFIGEPNRQSLRETKRRDAAHKEWYDKTFPQPERPLKD